jgi:hypothetical protein
MFFFSELVAFHEFVECLQGDAPPAVHALFTAKH